VTNSDFIAGVPAPIAHLSWLVGSWLGVGVGGETNGAPFQFAQEVQIGCDGREFLTHVLETGLSQLRLSLVFGEQRKIMVQYCS